MSILRTPNTNLPPELAAWNEKIRGWAKGYGLDFFDVIFEVLDYDELNEVAAYGGFPTRYPHWRFGMEYEELSKGYSYGLQKIYELVINNNPCYAYLMRSNHMVDQKLVMAHVYGHCDFFKNNTWFSRTNRKMLDEMANHATRVRRYMELHGLETVETFIDACLSIDNLIDIHSPFVQRRRAKAKGDHDEDDERKTVKKLKSKEYMDRYVNPPEFMEQQKQRLEEEARRAKNFPEEPERDVLYFLLEHAPLERWQRDVLDIIREEAYYFAPQAQTKIMNEGWACVLADTPVFSSAGLIPMSDVVAGEAGTVSDGASPRRVYGRNIIRDHEVITVRTRRGLVLGGSTNHRVLLADGSTWRRLDELRPGDEVAVAGGAGLWPEREIAVELSAGEATALDGLTKFQQAEPYRGGGSVTSACAVLATSVDQVVRGCHVRSVDVAFGATLGRLASASSDADIAVFERLTHGPSAREKSVPEAILRSPERVVRAFLSAYFDCDGHAGEQGVILSTMSEALGREVQLLLLNFGILSRRRRQTDGCWHLHVAGASAAAFAKKVGFGLERKQRALEEYIAAHRWFKAESWTDEVLEVGPGRADVYDISVEETHCYAAAGFVNHNSFWHSRIMTTKALTDSEVIDYADHHSGTLGSRPGSLNPYKIGIELFRDIEDRWNKGRFGKAWEECDDLDRKRSWDLKFGKGREKIFEVRKIYNDVLFIDEFLTPEFCAEHKLFTFEHNPQTGEYVIANREFKKVKEKLLTSLTNFGQPFIQVEDGNYENRGELLLRHRHEGSDLKVDYAKETLRNIQTIWGRPVHLETVVEKRRKLFSYDGKKHMEKAFG